MTEVVMTYDTGMMVADSLLVALTIVTVVVSLLAIRKDKDNDCV